MTIQRFQEARLVILFPIIKEFIFFFVILIVTVYYREKILVKISQGRVLEGYKCRTSGCPLPMESWTTLPPPSYDV